MTRYKFVGTDLYRSNGEHIENGDVIEPTTVELDSFGDLFREVEPEPEPPAECDTVQQDGEVCGRTLPCPYHA